MQAEFSKLLAVPIVKIFRIVDKGGTFHELVLIGHSGAFGVKRCSLMNDFARSSCSW